MSAPDESASSVAALFSFARHSVRVQLALWHTLALAVLLAAFAAGGYLFIDRTTRARGDRLLAESLTAFTAAWATERAESPQESNAVTALDAMQAARYQDRRVLLYDGEGRLIAISDTLAFTPEFSAVRLQSASGSPVSELVRAASAGGAPLLTIGHDDAWVRARAEPTSVGSARFVIVGLRDLSADDAITETYLNWLIVTLPLAVLLSGVGGYLIARRTLKPVVAIAQTARQISARSLDARLAVPNPTDELGQLASVLNQLLGRLEVSFDQQRQFMADASHELRTPVAVLRSAADIALAGSDRSAEELRDTLRIVSAEARRLTRTVEDLFLLARADAGEQPLRRERLYLEEVLHDAAQSARVLAAPHGITIVCEPAEESPFTGDAGMLSRVLLNLIDNAVKHTPDGGSVTLRLSRSDTKPTAGRKDEMRYCISVEDTGPGIPLDLQSRIFDRFVRTDQSRTRGQRADSGGAGLGLSIARWIAEEHRGTLELASTGSNGSKFELLLPSPTTAPLITAEQGVSAFDRTS